MPSPNLSVLIVEDSEDDALLLVRELERGYDVRHQRVDQATHMMQALDTSDWDLVIADYSMPNFSGTSALSLLRAKGLRTPFIFVSGTIGEDIAVNAMRSGAQDYIMKGRLARLLPAVERELREVELQREHQRTEHRLRQMEKFETIGKLAGGIAHDFNNVLGAIMGLSELGMGDVPADGAAHQKFQQIMHHSRKAADLTRQLLAFARKQVLAPRN